MRLREKLQSDLNLGNRALIQVNRQPVRSGFTHRLESVTIEQLDPMRVGNGDDTVTLEQ